MAEEQRDVNVYQCIAILEIQTMIRSLEDLFVSRYVANPENLRELKNIYVSAYDKLMDRKLFAEGSSCPTDRGWVHKTDCRCVYING